MNLELASLPWQNRAAWNALFAVLAFFGSAGVSSAKAHDNNPLTFSRLPRTNLLVYHGRNGEVLPVRTKSDWQKRRAEILRGFEDVAGVLPGREKRCALDVRIEQRKDCGSYEQRLITYSSEPGSRVPAYLLIPKTALESRKLALPAGEGRGEGERDALSHSSVSPSPYPLPQGRGLFPAVLCLHPTDSEFGNRVVVEKLRDYYPAYARELAERGFVTLSPAYPLLANYQPDLKALGWQSGTLKAVWDNIRGLDLLDSLPFVKHRKYGAVGHSLGGHNAIYTAIFDHRIKVVVSSCGFDSFLDYYGGDPANWRPEHGWCQTRYMPRLADYRGRLVDIPFDFHELIGALAPRPVFINAPLRDENFKWQSVDRVVKAASAIYRLYGVPQNLTVVHPDCPHDFPEDVRDQAYQLLKENLR